MGLGEMTMSFLLRPVVVAVSVWGIVGVSSLEVKGEAPAVVVHVRMSDPSNPPPPPADPEDLQQWTIHIQNALRSLLFAVNWTPGSGGLAGDAAAFVAGYRASGVSPNLTPAQAADALAIAQDALDALLSETGGLTENERAALVAALEDLIDDLG
jgi:hypothetical protein